MAIDQPPAWATERRKDNNGIDPTHRWGLYLLELNDVKTLTLEQTNLASISVAVTLNRLNKYLSPKHFVHRKRFDNGINYVDFCRLK